MSKILLKPFTDNDWEIYFGAEGDEPLVAYIDGSTNPSFVTVDNVNYHCAIVVDDNGIHADFIMDDQIEFTWQLDTDFETAKFVINETTLFTKPTTSSRLKSLHFYKT
ncbi:MAG: hypothetical protein ABIO63_08965 [Casimicrobiaceae bacterium]